MRIAADGQVTKTLDSRAKAKARKEKLEGKEEHFVVL